jgi:hypothetical protein
MNELEEKKPEREIRWCKKAKFLLVGVVLIQNIVKTEVQNIDVLYIANYILNIKNLEIINYGVKMINTTSVIFTDWEKNIIDDIQKNLSNPTKKNFLNALNQKMKSELQKFKQNEDLEDFIAFKSYNEIGFAFTTLIRKIKTIL